MIHFRRLILLLAVLSASVAKATTWRALQSGDFNSTIWTDQTTAGAAPDGHPTSTSDIARVYNGSDGVTPLTITVTSPATTGTLQNAYQGGPSTISLSTGGNLTIGATTSNYFAVTYGASGSGTLLQSGGALNLGSSKLYIGFSAGSDVGEFDYTGGTVNQAGNSTYLSAGGSSAGTFSISGSGSGNTISLGTLIVTGDSTATGTLKFAIDSGGVTPINTTQLTFGSGSANLALSLLSAPPTTGSVPNNIPLVTDSGAQTGTFSNLPQGSAIALSFGATTYNYTASYVAGTSKHDFDLIGVSTTPEPAFLAPIGASVAFLFGRFRRKAKESAAA